MIINGATHINTTEHTSISK